MVKLGVITDGISTDFENALKVMSDNGLSKSVLMPSVITPNFTIFTS
jgi:hypothetical protein